MLLSEKKRLLNRLRSMSSSIRGISDDLEVLRNEIDEAITQVCEIRIGSIDEPEEPVVNSRLNGHAPTLASAHLLPPVELSPKKRRGAEKTGAEKSQAHWSKSDDTLFRELLSRKVSREQIAATFKRSVGAVNARARDLQRIQEGRDTDKKFPPRTWTADDVAQLQLEYESAVTDPNLDMDKWLMKMSDSMQRSPSAIRTQLNVMRLSTK